MTYGINMKLLIAAIIVLHIFLNYPLEAQEKTSVGKKNLLLFEIASSIDEYKSKTITLRLKLKYIDKIFEKITFYDAKNHDIEFDISSRQLKKMLAADMINIHEGLEYNVTFTIQNVGNLGHIVAELKGFKPVLLDTFPDSDIKDN